MVALMRSEKREMIQDLRHEVNKPKAMLMTICDDMRAASPAKARQLEKIIARLEAWQNRQ